MNRWALAISMTAGMGAASWVAVAQEPAALKGSSPAALLVQEEKKEKGAKAGSFPGAEGGAVRLAAGQRSATANTRRSALGYTSAPVIDVSQPHANSLIVSMTGMSAASGLVYEESVAEVSFDLVQNFAIATDKPRPVRLTMEAQLIGLFRGSRDGPGVATSLPADADITAGGVCVAHVGFAGHTHTGKNIQFISERSPAVEAILGPGEYTLNQRFTFRCMHPRKCLRKNVVMAMFGDAGKLPEWVVLLDPSRDLPKNKDFGFKVAIRVDPVPLPPAPKIPDAKTAAILK